MIRLRHCLLHLPTTKLLFRILPFVLIISCTSKPVEEASSDTTAVEASVPEAQTAQTMPVGPPPDNGEWDADLNYVIDVPKGSVDRKDLVVVIKTKDEAGFEQQLHDEAGSISYTDVIYTINQPEAFVFSDTSIFRSEGQQGMEGQCFAEQIWYEVEYEGLKGWIGEKDGVYSIAETNIGGEAYYFDGIKDSLRLGVMIPTELDLHYHNEEFDYANADNCREVNVLFFYSNDKIYLIDGDIEDEWYQPAFNTSLTHMAFVNGDLEDLVIGNEPNNVYFEFPANQKARGYVSAKNGRLKLRTE